MTLQYLHFKEVAIRYWHKMIDIICGFHLEMQDGRHLQAIFA